MVKVFDRNLNLIIEGTSIEILKRNFRESIKLKEKNALNYYNFCDYLIRNNIDISNESLIENLSMDYPRDCKIEIIDLQNNNSKLDFWHEYNKYLLASCDDIFKLIEIAKDNNIDIFVGDGNNFEMTHILKTNGIKVGYKNYTYFLIKN